MSEPREPGWKQPSDEVALAAARALVALAKKHYPQRFYKERGWRIATASMIRRMADTVESMMALLEGRYALDTLILLRVLYEQVVIFCWLAIDPEKHIELWGANEHHYARALHYEALTYGYPALSSEGLKAAEKDAKKLKPIDQLATAVDEHWGGRLIGFRAPRTEAKDLLNFRGLYVGIYRVSSRAAHIQPESFVPYLSGPEVYPLVVGDAAPPDKEMLWWSLAVPLYAQALIMCNSVLKWPDVQAVLDINNTMYGFD